MKGNEGSQGQNERKWRPTRPKWKDMKVYNAKMKGKEGSKGQKLENGAGLGAAKFFVWEIGKTDNFWQLVGGGGGGAQKLTRKMPKCKEMKTHKAKMKGNEGSQGQNERKWRPTRPEWKEMKTHKAKIKEMKAQKAKNWKMEPVSTLLNFLYGRLGNGAFLATCGGGPQKLTRKKPKCKEMKAHKAKMKGNEGSQGQNERKWRPTRPKWKDMKAHKAKMKGKEGLKGQKLENGAGLGAAKFFVWEIGKTDHFWQLVGGGGPRSWPGKGQNKRKWKPTKPKWKEFPLNLDQARKGMHVQRANLNVPQEEMLLKLDDVRKGFHAQGANRNAPQEEVLLNMFGNSQKANRNVPQEELLLNKS